MYDTKNLGSGISIPYFFDLGVDKNFTITNRLYATENPLILGEYHQAFKNSNFLLILTDLLMVIKKQVILKKGRKNLIFLQDLLKNFKK